VKNKQFSSDFSNNFASMEASEVIGDSFLSELIVIASSQQQHRVCMKKARTFFILHTVKLLPLNAK
jgi:hypothetical protein